VNIAATELVRGAVTGWAAYAFGSLWAVCDGLVAAEDMPGLDITIDGTVPAGSGLSSSASVECAVGLASSTVLGLAVSRREIARRAQRAENDFVGVPTGSMDQVASMMSEPGCALYYDVRADTTRPVPLALDGFSFHVVDTRSKHALVDGGYAERRAMCERAAAYLEVDSLRVLADRDAGIDDALRALEDAPDGAVLMRRARHVVTEIARVKMAQEAIAAGNAPVLARLMCESHASLRDDFEVSCAELDLAVESALAGGASGARMTGGGFGGSALALVPEGREEAVHDSVMTAFANAGYAAPRLIAVTPGGGAHVLTS
jgi:galactokinase